MREEGVQVMGWAILVGNLAYSRRSLFKRIGDVCCFVSTTTDEAFGPLMRSRDEAESLAKIVGDPRAMRPVDLERALMKLRASESEPLPRRGWRAAERGSGCKTPRRPRKAKR